MSTISVERGQRRLAISQVLFTVAGVVLAGMFTGVFFVVDKREPELWYWLLMGSAAASLVYSCVAGGWGIEKLDLEHKHFDRQAIAVLLGFIFLVASLFFLGKEKADQQTKTIGQIQRDLGAISTNLKRLGEELGKAQQDQSAQLAELKKLRVDVEKLKHQPFPKKKSK